VLSPVFFFFFGFLGVFGDISPNSDLDFSWKKYKWHKFAIFRRKIIENKNPDI